CPPLCHTCLNISVLAIGENSDKYFNVRYFASITVDDLELLSSKVYEHFLPGNMVELHGAFFYRIFTAVILHKLGIAICIFPLFDKLRVVVQKGKAGMVTRPVYDLEK